MVWKQSQRARCAEGIRTYAQFVLAAELVEKRVDLVKDKQPANTADTSTARQWSASGAAKRHQPQKNAGAAPVIVNGVVLDRLVDVGLVQAVHNLDFVWEARRRTRTPGQRTRAGSTNAGLQRHAPNVSMTPPLVPHGIDSTESVCTVT